MAKEAKSERRGMKSRYMCKEIAVLDLKRGTSCHAIEKKKMGIDPSIEINLVMEV